MSAAPSTLEPVCTRGPRRTRAQSGQALAEYELLIALGALLVIIAMLFFAGKVDGVVRGAGESASDPAFKPPVAGQQCEASYQGVCVPPAPPDLDCADLVSMGIPLPVTLVGSKDPHGLDPDGDGLGC
jgi:Flp pilus assembly pilin Flp